MLEITNLILIIFILYQIIKPYYESWNLVHRRTTTGQTYRVRDQPGQQESAELLAELHQRLKQVVQRLASEAPDQAPVRRLAKRFRETELQERAGPHRFTSYTVNKGQKIVLCLRQRDGQLVDLNTLMFVGLHELAHIMTSQLDDQHDIHSAEFWKNYDQLLRVAQQMGLYRYQDYRTIPVEYCKHYIRETPLS